MTGQSRLLLIGLGATVGIAAVGVAIWLTRREKLPTEWRKVGEICDIMCFPIKSMAPIREPEMDCELMGLKKGMLRDRVFMVIDSNGKFVTARAYPKMVLITPEVNEEVLTLKAPGMLDVEINIDRLHKMKLMQSEVWGDKIRAVDCGEEAARWLSRFVLSDDTGFRLVYYPSEKPRSSPASSVFPKILRNDAGALTDATSYMILSENSVVDLNTRVEKPVTPQQFRPNFVVKGPEAFDEDNWDYVRIGSSAVFRNVRPCTRCLFTTIDPETGVKDSNVEPLKTLRKYRQSADPEVAKAEKYAPILGAHLGLRRPGAVKLGDPVYVNIPAQ